MASNKDDNADVCFLVYNRRREEKDVRQEEESRGRKCIELGKFVEKRRLRERSRKE